MRRGGNGAGGELDCGHSPQPSSALPSKMAPTERAPCPNMRRHGRPRICSRKGNRICPAQAADRGRKKRRASRSAGDGRQDFRSRPHCSAQNDARVSDDQVHEQIAVLNRDFRAANPDRYTRSPAVPRGRRTRQPAIEVVPKVRFSPATAPRQSRRAAVGTPQLHG